MYVFWQIVHLSPAEESYGESICTIRFASQVNSYSATSSLRSMSLSLGDQAPSVNSRSPSFTKAEAKSPKNLNIGTLRSNSYVGGGGKETPTRSGSAGIAQSPKASLLDESFGSPETVGSDPTSTPSKRVRGIAKVFTFDFDDENSVMEASPSRLLNDSSQSLGVDIMDVANQAESDHIEVPMPPSSSPSVLKKNSAAVTSPPAPITSKRGGYMSMTKSAAPGSDANSPEKVLLRKSSSNLSRTGSTGSEVKKSTTIRQTTRSASALPPPSPKTSSPIKRSVTSVTPSPAAKSATSKSKSTF